MRVRRLILITTRIRTVMERASRDDGEGFSAGAGVVAAMSAIPASELELGIEAEKTAMSPDSSRTQPGRRNTVVDTSGEILGSNAQASYFYRD